MVRALVGENLVGRNLVVGTDPGVAGNLNAGNSVGIVGFSGMGFNGLEQEEDKVLLGFCSRRCGVADNYYSDPLTECPVQIRDPL